MTDGLGEIIYFIVPDTIDDPEQVSGGNVYDRRVRDGLRSRGWDVRMILVAGSGDPRLTQLVSGLPDDAVVLIDGLVAVRQVSALAGQSSRLRLVVLSHMVSSLLPDWRTGADITAGHPAREEADELAAEERRALRAARRVIATSEWTRSELITLDLAAPHQVVVARPGTDPGAARVASPSGGRLLCVGAIAPHKGQDILLRALARLTDVQDWTCTIVGSQRSAPEFFAELRGFVESAGLAGRVTFAGVLTCPRLESAFGNADLVVVPSRSESYGMVAAEALARGIPVVATHVGGLAEAISHSAAGIVIPPDDPWALDVVLRQWWASPERREALNAEALKSRAKGRTEATWSATTALIASTLAGVARTGSALPA